MREENSRVCRSPLGSVSKTILMLRLFRSYSRWFLHVSNLTPFPPPPPRISKILYVEGNETTKGMLLSLPGWDESPSQIALNLLPGCFDSSLVLIYRQIFADIIG